MQTTAKERKRPHCTQFYLHMSAKMCTFAPEMVSNMELAKMKHTTWRCRHSYFQGVKGGGMRCAMDAHCTDGKCAMCEHWAPSVLATQYFAGELNGAMRNILSEIYLARVRRGTF